MSQEEGIQQLRPERRQQKLGQLVQVIEETKRQLTQPYYQLREESAEAAQSVVGQIRVIADETEGVYQQLADSDTCHQLRRSGLQDRYYRTTGWAEYTLPQYPQTIKRLENLGRVVLENPLFVRVAQTLVKFGDFYLGGGAIARAIQNFEQNFENFDFQFDLDLLIETEPDQLLAIANAMERKLTGVRVSYRQQPLPKIAIVSQDGKELINIVSTDYFVRIIDRVGQSLNRQFLAHSQIEKMLLYWPTEAVSQVALRFRRGGQGFEVRAVNAGRPLLPENLGQFNPQSVADYRIIGQLRDQGEAGLADRLLARMLRGLTRLPKAVEKQMGPGKRWELIPSEWPRQYRVALAEWLRISNDSQWQGFIRRVRREAANNLMRAVSIGDWEELGEILVASPLIGLFSPSLMKTLGFQLVQEGLKIGEAEVIFPREEQRASSLKSFLALKKPRDELTPTALLAQVTAIALMRQGPQEAKQLLATITQELTQSWPSFSDFSFNPDQFTKLVAIATNSLK